MDLKILNMEIAIGMLVVTELIYMENLLERIGNARTTGDKLREQAKEANNKRVMQEEYKLLLQAQNGRASTGRPTSLSRAKDGLQAINMSFLSAGL